jgi:hypothetical protein
MLALLIISQAQKSTSKTSLDTASDNISDGIDNVADRFDSRGPVEKIGDSMKDATN